MNFLVSWKTTIAGVAALMSALGHLLNALANGDTSTLATDAPLIIAAIGVIFAKDANVSGK